MPPKFPVGQRRSRVTASDMQHRSLAPALTRFTICEHCGSVVNDVGMTRSGKPCPVCGGARGRFSLVCFPPAVCMLIDLVQQAYHSTAHQVVTTEAADGRTSAPRLAVLVFYCTLGEVLLQHFLTRLMQKQRVPWDEQDQLLEDNQTLRRRLTRLFPKLTGDPWDTALRVLCENKRGDFRRVSEFHREAVEARNRLLHEGHKRLVPADMPQQCIDNLRSLIHLFVALHNHYITQRR